MTTSLRDFNQTDIQVQSSFAELAKLHLCDMEPDGDLNPDTDDLPLRANTNHIRVRHYVLDLTVHFDRKVISGSIVLFLQPCSEVMTRPQDGIECGVVEETGTKEAEKSENASVCSFQEVDTIKDHARDLDQTRVRTAAVDLGESTIKDMKGLGNAISRIETISGALSGVGTQAQAEVENIQSSRWWENNSVGDFTLVLDCCDLTVSKVEEVDVASLSAMCSHLAEVSSERTGVSSVSPQAALIDSIISMPSSQWRQQHQLLLQCSSAPGVQDGGSLHFYTDRWSLQVRKRGASSPQEFPHILRISYETMPAGGSVRWTKDQDNRVCVYTAGSPINNRALFPCQEPPVAMSTWQTTVRAPSECVVLMSGEEQAVPIEDQDPCFLIWNYYVTMPMPASTFTLAVGHWHQVTAEIPPAFEKELRDRMDCGKRAKLGAGSGEWTEAGIVSSLGSSTGEVVNGSTLQTGSGDQTTRADSAFCYSSLKDERLSVTDYSGMVNDGISCSHGDYPCRFTDHLAGSQRVIPHRVFAPVSLLQKAQRPPWRKVPQTGYELIPEYVFWSSHYLSSSLPSDVSVDFLPFCSPFQFEL
ncbi:hypothetical protein PAMP_022137 [Pampus punctatissimus]